MVKRYTLENKPTFSDGQKIKIDMSCFGLNVEILDGTVRGLATINVIDQWIVEFETAFPSYSYRTCLVPHTFIVDER